MSPGIPGWECYNHRRGPAVQCVCSRYFAGYCDPVRFYNFFFSQAQGNVQFNWLNNNEWLSVRPVTTGDCEFLWDTNGFAVPINLRLNLIDNPDFNPPVDPNPFLLDVAAKYNDIFTVSNWRTSQGFGDPNKPPRNQVWTFSSPVWIAGGANTPNALPPVGPFTFTPRLCQPGWYPGIPPG